MSYLVPTMFLYVPHRVGLEPRRATRSGSGGGTAPEPGHHPDLDRPHDRPIGPRSGRTPRNRSPACHPDPASSPASSCSACASACVANQPARRLGRGDGDDRRRVLGDRVQGRSGRGPVGHARVLRARTRAPTSPSSTCWPRTACGSISEIENVGPGLTRELVVRVRPGSYVTACKPGMVGDGIRSAFTVKDSGAVIEPTGDVAQQLTEAETSYVAYVKDQAGTLIAGTKAFADAYTAGDDDAARELYPRRARPLGAHRTRRGVLRRPRPPARRSRGRPRRRRHVERLALPGEGPVATDSGRQRRHDLRGR